MYYNFLLNPSCSELVTFLGLTNINDIRKVLKNLCDKFSYRIKLIPSSFDPLHNPGITIDIDKIGVNKDVKVMTFGNLIIDPTNTNLEKALYERLITLDYHLKHRFDHQKLREMVAFISNKSVYKDEIIKLVLINANNVYVEIQFQKCPGYDDTVGLSLQSGESSSIQEFPLLGNAYLQNPNKYKYMAFEKGSVSDFEEWLRQKIIHSDDKIAEWLKDKNIEEDYIKGFSFEGDGK